MNERVRYLERGIGTLSEEVPDAPDFGIDNLFFSVQRGNYYAINPADAPDDYFTTMAEWFNFAGTRPEGFGRTTAQPNDNEFNSIFNRVTVASNNYFNRHFVQLYQDRTITTPVGVICLYDRDQLDQFFVNNFGFGAVDTVNAIWDNEDAGYFGRGQEPTTSKAVTVEMLKTMNHETMQNLCAVLSAPNLAAAVRLTRYSQDQINLLLDQIENEEDRIAINIARIQGEINTLSRYI